MTLNHWPVVYAIVHYGIYSDKYDLFKFGIVKFVNPKPVTKTVVEYEIEKIYAVNMTEKEVRKEVEKHRFYRMRSSLMHSDTPEYVLLRLADDLFNYIGRHLGKWGEMYGFRKTYGKSDNDTEWATETLAKACDAFVKAKKHMEDERQWISRNTSRTAP